MEKFGIETIEVIKKKHLNFRDEIIEAVKDINQIKKQARNAEDFLNELHS